MNAEQKLMLSAWNELDMQGRSAQVAVGLSTRQLFKQYSRADDTGYAIRLATTLPLSYHSTTKISAQKKK